MATIRLKRAYEEPSRSDGLRILVERLWPRGLSKARAAVDVWLKEIAPVAASLEPGEQAVTASVTVAFQLR